MKSTLLVRLFLFCLILVCFFSAHLVWAAEKNYKIEVEPSIISGDEVKLEIVTNIPGTIEVMAAIELYGQKNDDTWIGKNERVKISNGNGSCLLYTSEAETVWL